MFSNGAFVHKTALFDGYATNMQLLNGVVQWNNPIEGVALLLGVRMRMGSVERPFYRVA